MLYEGPTYTGLAVTKAQALAERLTTAIAVGQFSPGDRIPSEREIADQFSVSRVTVREAIRLVAGEGLLVSRRGRDGGTFVTESGGVSAAPEVIRRTLERALPALREFSDYRCLVEGTIARTAAERCTPVDATRLWARMADFDTASSLSAARGADRRLHTEIAAVARNDHLSQLSVKLSADATLGFGSEPYPLEYLERATREHRELVEAIVDRDMERSFRAAREHYALTLEILEQGLRTVSDDS